MFAKVLASLMAAGLIVFAGCCPPANDADGDGVPTLVDDCPNTPTDEQADENGCSCSQLDEDGDGVDNCDDQCPGTTAGEQVDANGCSATMGEDEDEDGVADGIDNCRNVKNPGQEDRDSDGVGDACDGCPNDSNKADPGACGCGTPDSDFRTWCRDADGDGHGDSNDTKEACDQPSGYVSSCDDDCPNDPNKTNPGACGCGTPDSGFRTWCRDADGDGHGDANDTTKACEQPSGYVLSCNDQCPNTPAGEQVDAHGCSCSQLDDDNDGVNNCTDKCPGTPTGEDLACAGCSCSQLSGAVRDLEVTCYTLGNPLSICISVCPPAGTSAVGLEDSPPDGWTDIINISEGGVYDSVNHKVKWGPFFTPFPINVTYQVTPPQGAQGQQCFVGGVSFDGLNQTIQGNDCSNKCP